MTRANTEQIKHTPWFAKAGAACSIVPISRFVGPKIFALKGGGYGCLFSLTGLDEEALTDLELEARVSQVEGALRGLPEGSCLYQYTRVMSGFDLPRQKRYGSEVTETFANDRLTHLDKTAAFRRIDLHWCLTLGAIEGKGIRAKARGERRRYIPDALGFGEDCDVVGRTSRQFAWLATFRQGRSFPVLQLPLQS